MHSPMVTDAACFSKGWRVWLSLSIRELCQGLEELRKCDSEVSFISAAPAMRALRETGHSIASLALRFDFCCIPCKVGCKIAKNWSFEALCRVFKAVFKSNFPKLSKALAGRSLSTSTRRFRSQSVANGRCRSEGATWVTIQIVNLWQNNCPSYSSVS